MGLNFPFQGVDSRPMSEALLPAAERKTPPKLVITMIWDAAGMDVLDEWPNAWPFLKSLEQQGTWYSDATVGTSPTISWKVVSAIPSSSPPNRISLARMASAVMSGWPDAPGCPLHSRAPEGAGAGVGTELVVSG